MGERIAFATSNWKDRPNKPAGKTQAEWDAEGSSKFSGFPFPIYVGKKWSGQIVQRGEVFDYSCTNYLWRQCYDWITDGPDCAFDSSYSCGESYSTCPNTTSSYDAVTEDGWMTPKNLPASEFSGSIFSNLDAQYDYAAFDFSNLPSGVSTDKRYIIDPRFGFLGPFTREEITRFWRVVQRRALTPQYKIVGTYQRGTRKGTDAYEGSEPPCETGISSYTENSQNPNYIKQNRDETLKLRFESDLIVCDIDSPGDFYLYIRNNQIFLNSIQQNLVSYVSALQYPSCTTEAENTNLKFLQYFGVFGYKRSDIWVNTLNSNFVEPTGSFGIGEGCYWPFEIQTHRIPNVYFTHTIPQGESKDPYDYVGGSCGNAGRRSAYVKNIQEVEIPVELWAGKTKNLKVIKISYNFEGAGTGYPNYVDCGIPPFGAAPEPTINEEIPLTLKAMEFHEYATSQGEPVYDKDTGAELRDPLS
jgi:hypothetical protein